MKKIHGLSFLALLLFLSACQSTQISDSTNQPVGDATSETSQAQQDIVSDQGTNDDEVSTSQNYYVNFTQEQYDELLGKKPFALFFHAAWCPTCVSLEKEILSQYQELPADALILKANFDTETALKEKYGIKSQSIVLMLDAQGNVQQTLVGPVFDQLKTAFETLL